MNNRSVNSEIVYRLEASFLRVPSGLVSSDRVGNKTSFRIDIPTKALDPQVEAAINNALSAVATLTIAGALKHGLDDLGDDAAADMATFERYVRRRLEYLDEEHNPSELDADSEPTDQ